MSILEFILPIIFLSFGLGFIAAIIIMIRKRDKPKDKIAHS
jgi:hypothetical protein